jgi:hypothetical protein
MTLQRYLIELHGEAAGLVVRDSQGYRFYAAASTFADLESRIFRSPAQAEAACRHMIRRQERDVSPNVEAAEFIPEGGVPYGFPFTMI